MKHFRLLQSTKWHNFLALGLVLLSFSNLAQAQQRACIVDDYTWQVSCGRLATYEEINQYQFQNQNQTRYPSQPTPQYQPHYPQEYRRPEPIIVPSPAPKTDVWHQNIQVAPAPTIYERKTDRSEDRHNNKTTDSDVTDHTLGEFINRTYQEVLGRNADKAGLNSHIAQIRQGKGIDTIRASLASSAEAKKAINKQYNQVLGRNGDAAGINYFQQKLIAGANLADVRRELADSEEGRKKRR